VFLKEVIKNHLKTCKICGSYRYSNELCSVIVRTRTFNGMIYMKTDIPFTPYNLFNTPLETCMISAYKNQSWASFVKALRVQNFRESAASLWFRIRYFNFESTVKGLGHKYETYDKNLTFFN
jgi:hypothetical protein